MIIRKATFEDSAEIANVHINSWREAYKGLLPQDFLDERPLYFKNRYNLWKKLTVDESQITFVAECSENGVVGFINGGIARDKDFFGHIEVYCIYLLQKYHGKKIGFELLRMYFDEAQQRGYGKAYLWVLDENPTIKFYERAGAKNTGQAKDAFLMGQLKVKELCFCWDQLSF